MIRNETVINFAYVGIEQSTRGMTVNEWLWMHKFCQLSLNPKSRASIGDSCIWWNEV